MDLRLNTYSIVARDRTGGELGVAIVTRLPAVGSICPSVRHGVGAVVTQAWTNPYLAPRVLDLIAGGSPAADAVAAAMASDPDSGIRQIGVVDAGGRSAAFTGGRTDPWAGHRTGPGYSIQGNMLTGPGPVEAMEAAFLADAAAPLAERLLRAIEAALTAGGDRRGQRSAALLVRGPEIYPLVDLRVDEHDSPTAELRRIYEVAKRDLFPFVRALPTRDNPLGRFETVRDQVAPRD